MNKGSLPRGFRSPVIPAGLWSRVLMLLLMGWNFHSPAQSSLTESVLYQTGFEFAEGFTAGFTAVGQDGWEGTAEGGNGIEPGLIPDTNDQQAYIGFGRITSPAGERILNLYKPINYVPPAQGPSVVRFSVRMQIVPSTNQVHDFFRWSVYNTDIRRLFSLDFDVNTGDISYLLEGGTNYVFTGRSFDTLGFYDLEIWMDLGRNAWTAQLNGAVVVNSKPLALAGTRRDIGDIDAVWDVQSAAAQNNDYMIFDDYRVSVVHVSSIPPRLEQLGVSPPDRAFRLRAYGQSGLNYAIEATADFQSWQTLLTVKAPADGIIEYRDPPVAGTAARFYRVRHVP